MMEFEKTAARAFTAFPLLSRIATTVRVECTMSTGTTSRRLLATRGALSRTRTFNLEAIVDRIGTGDAFAAGLLHGLLRANG